MNKDAALTRRENEIAELIAWGATAKDVANRLYLSAKTVENHIRNIYGKTGVTKVNELSAWWFCTTYHIPFDLSPLRRSMAAWAMLMILLPQALTDSGDQAQARPASRTARVVRTRTARRRAEDGVFVY